jgi:hypothetical protein
LWSRTLKQASVSSTDHGGGKRRAHAAISREDPLSMSRWTNGAVSLIGESIADDDCLIQLVGNLSRLGQSMAARDVAKILIVRRQHDDVAFAKLVQLVEQSNIFFASSFHSRSTSTPVVGAAQTFVLLFGKQNPFPSQFHGHFVETGRAGNPHK